MEFLSKVFIFAKNPIAHTNMATLEKTENTLDFS